MRDSDADAPASPTKIFTRGGAKPVVRKTGQQRFGTMKVITVAAEDVGSRDAAIVTITPTSQRITQAEAPEKIAAASTDSGSKGPNWIFGHE